MSVCSARRNGEDNGVDTRREPGMESVFWTQQDIDSIPHRHKMPWMNSKDNLCNFIHNLGHCEVKTFNRKIDDFQSEDRELVGRNRSQAETHNRFSRRAMAGMAGNISPLMPGVGGMLMPDGVWEVYHGHAGIEFSEANNKTSEKITWCRPQIGKPRYYRNYLLFEIKRWEVTWNELMELLRYERSWDDPFVIIGKEGVCLPKGRHPSGGLRLSKCGSVWVLGEIDLDANHSTWINNLPLPLMEKIYDRVSPFASMEELFF